MEYVTLVSPVLKVFDKLETIVNKYYERGDIAQDNRNQLVRIQRRYEAAKRILRRLEYVSSPDFVSLELLSTYERTFEEDVETLESLKEPASTAKRMTRVRRVKDILDQCEARIKEFFEFLSNNISPMLLHAPSTSDKYTVRYTVPPNPPRLILEYDKSTTSEGKLKATVLSERQSRIVAVIASGQGGVGKTCALRGLAEDGEVKSVFPGGILYIQLGNDATMASIITGISTVVKKTGGAELAKDIRGMNNLTEAADKASHWFHAHTCLFLVDDIWQVNGIDCDVLTTLGCMVNERSRMVYTTRDERFLYRADTVIEFEKKEVSGRLSYRMLMEHARFDAESELDENNTEALHAILRMCDGLPLAHSIAGSAVWKISRNLCSERKQYAWSKFHNDILTKRENMLDGLSNIVDTSLEVLEKNSIGGRYSERFRALCVLQKQQKAPVEMLQKLWDMEDLAEAEEAVDRFREVSIAQKREEGGSHCMQLHDLVLEIAIRMTEGRERCRIFRNLILNYIPSARIGDPWFEWWEIQDDGYFCDNVCRLLRNAGLAFQLMWLLSKPQWIAKRLVSGGIYAVEQDLKHGIAIAEDSSYSYSNHKEHLEMVGRAARMSCTVVATNPREVWFQLHGRLLWHATKCDQTKTFVREIEECAPRPWVKASLGLLQPPGAVLEIVRSPKAVRSISMQQGELWFSCGSRKVGDSAISKYKSASGFHITKRFIIDEEHLDVLIDFRIHCEMFLPDQGCVMTAGIDTHGNGKIVTWDRETGMVQRVVECPEFVKIGTWDEELAMMYGVEEYLERFQNHPFLAFSSDGTRVMSTDSVTQRIRVWNTRNGEAVGLPLEGHHDTVYCVAMSADGSRVVSGSVDRTVRVWDAHTGEALTPPFVGHTGEVLCIAVSADGNRIVSGSADRTVRIWDAHTGEARTPPCVGHTESVRCVAVSADGNRVVSGSYDKTVRVWDGHTGEELAPPRVGHTGRVDCVAVSADGSRIVSGSSDRTVRVWNANTGEALSPSSVRHKDEVLCFGVSADGSRIVSGSCDNTVRLWDGHTGEAVTPPCVGHTRWVRCVAVSADGRRAVSGSNDKTVRVWDAHTGKALTSCVGHRDGVYHVVVNADGSRIVSVSEDRTIRVWDGHTGEVLTAPCVSDTGRVWCVAVSADGCSIVLGSSNTTVRGWDAHTGKALTPPCLGHRHGVNCVAVSADGSRIVSGSEDMTVRLWNGHTGAALTPPCVGHTDTVWCVAVSADGNRIASGSSDKTVRVWDGRTGEAVTPPCVGHTGTVWRVAVSADGNRVISESDDNTIRVWNAHTGRRCEPTSEDAALRSTLGREWSTGFDFKPTDVQVRDGEDQNGRALVLATCDEPVRIVGDKGVYFSELFVNCRILR